MKSYNPVALIILDGWGIREMEHGNAVALARTPNYTRWLKTNDRSILDASGEAVGLTTDQMGNSEVGHLNLGAGFVVYQNITRIDKAIADGSLVHHPILKNSFAKIKSAGQKVHLVGLVSSGGVHSHTRHLFSFLELAKQNEVKTIVHVITDGRDTPPNSGLVYVKELEQFLANNKAGTIASVSGRYYAMDRDQRWDRTKLAYDTMVLRQGPTSPSASQAVKRSYELGISDEFIVPTIITSVDESELRVESGDCFFFFNFRADRMRQLVSSLATTTFNSFERQPLIEDLIIITATEYNKELQVSVLFPSQLLTNPLAKVISDDKKRQFHAAETEKYAHVTYFINGGREEPFDGEDRLLVPSPKVATYNLKPEMSAYELTEKVIKRIQSYNDDFLVVNFANPDMVGHTGVLDAAIKAVEVVDDCAGKLVQEINQKGGVAVVTADHGNAECMIDELTNNPHTYHTTNPVSLFIIGNKYFPLRPRGILADVAPTILELMGLSKPNEMTGRSLLDYTSLEKTSSN